MFTVYELQPDTETKTARKSGQKSKMEKKSQYSAPVLATIDPASFVNSKHVYEFTSLQVYKYADARRTWCCNATMVMVLQSCRWDRLSSFWCSRVA